jgi:hypothetical protein
MLLRKRWSKTLVEVHTSHWQPTMGTPLLVPVPKNVTVRVLLGIVVGMLQK